jgi:hypothetical protein
MSIVPAIPKPAQELLEAISQCEQETQWKDGTYLHPRGKVVFQGVITPGDKLPDGRVWVGEKPLYLIVYHHPNNSPRTCDAHWFDLDVIDVEVATGTPLLEQPPE